MVMDGKSNADLLDLAFSTLPSLRTVIAHGAEAHRYVASRRWPDSITVVQTKHLRLLSYEAIDRLAASY